LKALLQLYVDHSTIVEGLSIADVSTTLSLSRAHIEAVVGELLSEGYLYETIDDEHHLSTCDEMPSGEQLSSLAASQPPPAPQLRRLEVEAVLGTRAVLAGFRSRRARGFDRNARDSSNDDARPPTPEEKRCSACFDLKPLSAFSHGAAVLCRVCLETLVEADPNEAVAHLHSMLEETTLKLRRESSKLREVTRERDDHERERQTAYKFIEMQKDELARKRRDIQQLEFQMLSRCVRLPPYFTGAAGLAGARIIADYSCDSASRYIFLSRLRP